MKLTDIDRRQWLKLGSASLAGAASSGWLQALAAATSEHSVPKHACLLLWMNGGPSQLDTFDMKPGHENGGPFQSIPTNVPGISISEHLPKMSQWMHRHSIVRSMTSREGDHQRARDHLRTGYTPQGSIEFPVFGSLVSHEWGPQSGDLPNYVSILSGGLFRSASSASGFLGPNYAPLMIGRDDSGKAAKMSVENLVRPSGVSEEQFARRRDLLNQFQVDFLKERSSEAAAGHTTAYEKSLRLMSPSAAEAFDLSREPAAILEKYGSTTFGQGCLLARRMLERHVPFVEVSLGGWDTHIENFKAVQNLSTTLDNAWSALLGELEDRGLLDTTLILWMGEFGRTPVINPQVGRDHYPKAWSAVLGGGPIRGGQVVGRTSADGLAVEDRPTTIVDLLATICLALGIDPLKQNMSTVNRPIRIVDPVASPILDLIA